MSDFNQSDAIDGDPQFNPYKAPSAAKTKGGRAGAPFSAEPGLIWTEWDVLVLVKGTPLPDRCVKCNAPANGYTLKRTLSWHHPGWYILALSPLIYILAYLIVRRTAVVYVGLCDKHRRGRIRDILIGWLCFLGGVAGMIIAAQFTDQIATGWIFLICIVSVLFGLIYGMMRAQIVTAKKIDKELVRLRGVSPLYLAEIDQTGGAPGVAKPLYEDVL
jgi:hypothetical protein